MTDTVRVPWVAGTVAGSSQRPTRQGPTRRERCEAKARRVRDDVKVLKRHRAASSSEAVMAKLDASIESQEHRIGILTSAAVRAEASLVARGRQIEADLGPEACAFLAGGMPSEMLEDVRMVRLLSELAIIRFALGRPADASL